ncbi:hypothetical protein TNCV_487711 [Trichonephila clavipes]|nr:hypothetical protein TNCV_487711 [Trichonephila clavipes]
MSSSSLDLASKLRLPVRFKLISGPGHRRSVGPLGTGGPQENLVKYSQSGPLGAHLKPPMDKPTLRSTRGLLVTDLVVLNHGQVARMTPELTLTMTPITNSSRVVSKLNVYK